VPSDPLDHRIFKVLECDGPIFSMYELARDRFTWRTTGIMRVSAQRLIDRIEKVGLRDFRSHPQFSWYGFAGPRSGVVFKQRPGCSAAPPERPADFASRRRTRVCFYADEAVPDRGDRFLIQASRR
jgi:hypothetical protein